MYLLKNKWEEISLLIEVIVFVRKKLDLGMNWEVFLKGVDEEFIVRVIGE